MTVEELKEEYEQKINALKEEFNNKIAELQKEKESNKRWWKPVYGENYYYISALGEVGCNTYGDDRIDKKSYSFYNMFQTKEEAEFEAERWKVLRELEMLADDDKEWDGCHMHYAIKNYGKTLCIIMSVYDRTHPFYFKSAESAEKAANVIGEDRIKKYWFGIKEE